MHFLHAPCTGCFSSLSHFPNPLWSFPESPPKINFLLRCEGRTPDRQAFPRTREPGTLWPPGKISSGTLTLTCFGYRCKPVQQLLQTSVICHRLPGVCQDGTERREEPGALWVHDEAGAPAKALSGPAPACPSHRHPHARPGPRTLTSAQATTAFRRKLQVAGMDVKPQLRRDRRLSRASRALHPGAGDGGNLQHSRRPEQLKVGQPGTLVGGEIEGSTKPSEAAGGPEGGARARSGAGHVQEAERLRTSRKWLSPDWRVSVPPRVSVKTLQQQCAGRGGGNHCRFLPGGNWTCVSGLGRAQGARGSCAQVGLLQGGGVASDSVCRVRSRPAWAGASVCPSLARLSPCARRPPCGPR